jgi:hypothetical protein
MIKSICCVLGALAIISAGSWQVSAEAVGSARFEQGSLLTHLAGTQAFRPNGLGNFSPVIRLAGNCKPDGKPCKSNTQCCSGNCQKGTDMPKGTCLHGD